MSYFGQRARPDRTHLPEPRTPLSPPPTLSLPLTPPPSLLLTLAKPTPTLPLPLLLLPLLPSPLSRTPPVPPPPTPMTASTLLLPLAPVHAPALHSKIKDKTAQSPYNLYEECVLLSFISPWMLCMLYDCSSCAVCYPLCVPYAISSTVSVPSTVLCKRGAVLSTALCVPYVIPGTVLASMPAVSGPVAILSYPTTLPLSPFLNVQY